MPPSPANESRPWQLGRFLILIVTLAGLATGGIFAGRTLWARHHWRLARSAMEQGDFASASTHLALCVKVWPDSLEAHLAAAQSARRTGRLSEAQQHLQECQRIQGVSNEAVTLEWALLAAQRGEASAKQENYLLSGVQRGVPETTLILEALTQGYLVQHRLSPAMYCLKLWLQREPDNRQALIRRAWINARMENTQDALADLRRAVELAPDDLEGRKLLSALLLDANLPAEAAPQFEWLRQREPDNMDVLFGLARCRRQEGRLDEAGQLLDQLVRSPADAKKSEAGLLAERGRVALLKGSAAEAEPWLRQAINLEPYDFEANYSMQQCLRQLGRTDEAKKLEQISTRLAADQKRLRVLTNQIVNTPHDPALLCEAGLIMLRNGREDEGRQFLRNALREDPGHEEARRALTESLTHRGPVGSRP